MELYAAVRRSVYVEGLSERAAARRFGLARETVRKMLRYRLPPGYRRKKPIRCPKLDAFTGVIDQILRDDQSPSEEATSHGQAHLRALTRGARLHGRRHDRESLRAREEAGRAGDVHTARASAGRRPGRFRRSAGRDRWRRLQGARPGRGSPAQRRRVREGVSGRDDGGVLRRAQRRVRLLRWGAAAHRLRQHQAGGGADSRGRHAPADAGLLRTPIALFIRRSLRAAGQGQRQREGGRAGRLRPPQLLRADPPVRQLGRVERRPRAQVQRERRGRR